jgi:phosphatidylinositol alpha-1,6-mannosyltransferase
MPKSPLKLLVAALDYPPRPYGVSSLTFSHVEGLAELSKKSNDPVLQRLQLSVVAPLFLSDTGGFQPVEGVTEHRFRVIEKPILRTLPMVLALAWHWLRIKPDLVYCPQYRAMGPLVMLLARLTKTPYVAYFHGTEILTEKKSRRRLALLRRFGKGAALCLANSKYSCRLVDETVLETDEKQAVELNPPVNLQRFKSIESARPEIRQRLGSDDRRVLLTVCHLTPRKAVDAAVESVLHLYCDHSEGKNLPPLDYWICGDGPEKDRIVTMIEEKGVPVAYGEEPFATETAGAPLRTRFVGKVNLVEVASYFAGADLFMMVSRTLKDNVESFGIVYLEAAACKLPVIASDVGGVGSAVVDGETGLMVPPDDIEATADALKKLLTDADLSKRLGEAGRKRAEESFTNGHLCAKLWQHLKAKFATK